MNLIAPLGDRGPSQSDRSRAIRLAIGRVRIQSSSRDESADGVTDSVYEATEIARVLIEVEGTSLSPIAERDAEDRVRAAMEDVHRSSRDLRYDRCPNCGERLGEDAIESDDA